MASLLWRCTIDIGNLLVLSRERQILFVSRAAVIALFQALPIEVRRSNPYLQCHVTRLFSYVHSLPTITLLVMGCKIFFFLNPTVNNQDL